MILNKFAAFALFATAMNAVRASHTIRGFVKPMEKLLDHKDTTDARRKAKGDNNIYDQKFWFDCHVPNESNLGTNDMLVGYFYDANDNLLDSQEKPYGISCSPNYQHYFDIQSSTKVDHVRLIIVTIPSGDEGDSLFIDWAWLEINGQEEQRWDGDGTKGWCLSTESDDVETGSFEDNSYWDECVEQACFRANGDVEQGDCNNIPPPPPPQDDNVKFWFDCHMPYESNLATDNKVLAYFYEQNDDLIAIREIEPGAISCTEGDFNTFDVMTSETVWDVRLVIEGMDSLLIDYAWMTVDGNEVERWDGDGNQGWCLSQDKFDVDSLSWDDNSYWDHCEEQICFKRNDGVFPGDICDFNAPSVLDEGKMYHIQNDQCVGVYELGGNYLAEIFDCQGDSHTIPSIKYYDDHTIRAYHSGRAYHGYCLDRIDDVSFRPCNDSDNQQWNQDYIGNNAYMFQNVGTYGANSWLDDWDDWDIELDAWNPSCTCQHWKFI